MNKYKIAYTHETDTETVQLFRTVVQAQNTTKALEQFYKQLHAQGQDISKTHLLGIRRKFID